ncbi:hypothetical protein [Bacillus litorisediminis]|uniref:hypothetical protein n=1 Tax=Bacillus litorisediminis TaxID=2922713 RepID=UPI001FAD78C3|nr:hypothetical protein [Bacillus litorisediminis]
MEILKVSNLIQSNGQADYKGLDISKIQAGSQLYPSTENTAYFFYSGEVQAGPEVTVIDQATYDNVKAQIEQELANIVTPEKKLEQLEQQQDLMQKAIDDLILSGSGL